MFDENDRFEDLKTQVLIYLQSKVFTRLSLFNRKKILRDLEHRYPGISVPEEGISLWNFCQDLAGINCYPIVGRYTQYDSPYAAAITYQYVRGSFQRDIWLGISSISGFTPYLKNRKDNSGTYKCCRSVSSAKAFINRLSNDKRLSIVQDQWNVASLHHRRYKQNCLGIFIANDYKHPRFPMVIHNQAYPFHAWKHQIGYLLDMMVKSQIDTNRIL
jgi:hypothetical protein